MNRALFLDRDGVIIENVASYVRSWDDVVILPGAVDALARLKPSPLKIILVTNQSAVGRGILSLSDARQINARLVGLIESAGGRVDGVFMCPHAPQELCSCRKPEPGLFLQAAASFSLDLGRSILVGDALTDIRAGQAAGIQTNVLVRTGRGADQLALPEARLLPPFAVYDHLSDVIVSLLPGLLS